MGEEFTNIARGQGTGKITYSSDNPVVASVDAGGMLSPLAEGSTLIRAQIAADSTYLAAETSYEVRIVPKDIPLTAWIGKNDTLVNLPSTTNGFTLYRSTDYKCNFENYLACPDAKMDILNGTTITDLITTQSQAAYYQLQSGGKKANLGIGVDTIAPGENIQITEFKDQLWMIDHSRQDSSNSIWSSRDGVTWISQKTATLFSPRSNFQLVTFQNKLWVIGGRTASGLTNDIWSSTDGIEWVLENSNPSFSARYLHKAFTFKNRLWLIGGFSSGYKSDVWSSNDGIEWMQHASDADFSPRAGHEIIIHREKLWLIGGTNSLSFNDVWVSDDAIIWRQVTNSAEFRPRYLHQVVSFQDQIWLIGGSVTGSDFTSLSDIWFSSDGENWSNQTEGAPFGGRLGHQLKFFMQKFFIYGGGGEKSIWTSKSLSEWQKEESSQINIEAAFDQAVYFKQRYWLVGGDYRRGKTNTVWTSTNGLEWVLDKENAEFSARNGHTISVFNNKIWLIGGEDELGLQNDIWSSDDGVFWVKSTEAAPFSPRKNHKLVQHKNELFILGGDESHPLGLNDVWSSPDGSSWIKKSDHTGFPTRRHHQFVSHKNRIWVIGGEKFEGGLAHDIWSSLDGVDWHQEVSETAFSPRYQHQTIIFQDQILLVGGMTMNYTSNNDVWVSADGVSWQQLTMPPFVSRAGHKLISNDGDIKLISGTNIAAGYTFAELYFDVWSSSDAVNWRKGFRGTFKLAD